MANAVQLVNIGFGNMVSAERMIALVSPESAPIKRIVQDSKLSALQPETVANRFNNKAEAEDGDEAEL